MVYKERSEVNSFTSIPDKFLAAGIFSLAFVGRVGYWFIDGTGVNPSTGTFLNFCHLDVGKHMTEILGQEAAEFFLYAGYWVPLCLVQSAPLGSPDVMVFIQIVASSLACVVVFDIGRRHVNLLAGAVAGVALAILFDGFVWTTRLLGDSTLVFVLVLSIWALGRYVDNPTKRNRVIVWICFGYLSVTRPYGFPIVAGWIAYDLLPRDNSHRFELFPYRKVALGVLAISIPVALYLLTRWGSNFLPDFWTAGTLVANDPAFPTYPFELRETDSFAALIILNIHHIIAMGVLKILAFFVPVVPRFSILHNILNIFTFIPVYAIGIGGIVTLYRNDRELLSLWVTPLLVILGIISVTFVDYSWGYRAPTGPLFALITGYVVAEHPWFSPVRRIGGMLVSRLPS